MKEISIYESEHSLNDYTISLRIGNHYEVLTEEEFKDLSNKIKKLNEKRKDALDHIRDSDEFMRKIDHIKYAKESMKVKEDGTVGFLAEDRYFDEDSLKSLKEINVKIEGMDKLKKRINKIENTLLNVEFNSDLSMKIFQFKRQVTDINIRLLKLEVENEKEIQRLSKENKALKEIVGDEFYKLTNKDMKEIVKTDD